MARALRAIGAGLVWAAAACGPGTTVGDVSEIGADTDATDTDATDTAASEVIADVADGDAAPGASAWLEVRGHRITHADGRPFRGRGANLHDERSCSACSFAAREPAGVDRWADELIDGWHATLVRFLLSAKGAPYNEWEQQWRSLSDDPDYLEDVVANVTHMTGKGAYVLVTLFADPTMKTESTDYDSEWPGSAGDTNARYRLLAERFVDEPRVLFGLTNEPHTTRDHAPELAARYASAIATIREIEDVHGSAHHLVVVQAPEGWARDLGYFVDHPLEGDNIVYEIHPYNPAADFERLITTPAQTLPILIGEYGPAFMDESDIRALWALARALDIPHIAWNFHMRCPPNLLEDTATDGCGLAASTGYDFPRTAWGDLLHEELAKPW